MLPSPRQLSPRLLETPPARARVHYDAEATVLAELRVVHLSAETEKALRWHD
jgi:hypothetical protein